jgi:hypothetical protein
MIGISAFCAVMATASALLAPTAVVRSVAGPMMVNGLYLWPNPLRPMKVQTLRPQIGR